MRNSELEAHGPEGKSKGNCLPRLILTAAGCVLLAGGCRTVGLENRYSETLTEYADDGVTVVSTNKIEQSNNSYGGPFTDLENLKQDSLVTVTNGPDVGWSVAQGAGVASVSGAGQVEAFQAGLTAGTQMLGMLMPFLMAPDPAAGTPLLDLLQQFLAAQGQN